MFVIYWQILGIILLIITYIVNKHTLIQEYCYNTGSYITKKAPSKVWMLIVGVILALIPFLNLGAFIVGMFAWVISHGVNDVMLDDDHNSIIHKTMNFLNKQV